MKEEMRIYKSKDISLSIADTGHGVYRLTMKIIDCQDKIMFLLDEHIKKIYNYSKGENNV